ncbi:MAG: phosphopantetheine-binding protein [Paracoccaceae bacterium]
MSQASPTTTETLAQLQRGIMDMLALDSVDLDVALAQLGIDSLNVVELILICQQVYVSVTDFEAIDIDENTTLREVDEQMLALSRIPA